MVTQITEGTAFDKHGRPFRRRNPRPAIVVVSLLAGATVQITAGGTAQQATPHTPGPGVARRERPAGLLKNGTPGGFSATGCTRAQTETPL